MTAFEWASCTDPALMLAYLRDCGLYPTARKFRLLAVACCRQVWHLLRCPVSRRAVEVAELYTDGLATKEDLRLISCDIHGIGTQPEDVDDGSDNAWWEATRCINENAGWVVGEIIRPPFSMPPSSRAHTMREVLGDPSRPVRVDCFVPAVVDLAQAAYEQRTPDFTLDPHRLAVLADALEDVGVWGHPLLDHLRSPGPHYRGCWAVDLILGKE